MDQIIAVACGGALGAVMRFLVASGVYQWLGRDFPFGTLAVNVMGSFLLGLMTEALILQRIAISQDYRTAVLVGLFGSFTTFSTFSLETLALLEQGNIAKAGTNIVVSIVACLLAVWIGLMLGRLLFKHTGGIFYWMGWMVPYGLLFVNAVGAFLIGIICTVLMMKTSISLENRAALTIVLVGLFITLSSLYLILYLIETGVPFKSHLNAMLFVVVSNFTVCGISLWLGLLAGKQF